MLLSAGVHDPIMFRMLLHRPFTLQFPKSSSHSRKRIRNTAQVWELMYIVIKPQVETLVCLAGKAILNIIYYFYSNSRTLLHT